MKSTIATDKPKSFRRTKRVCVSVEVFSIVAYFCLKTVICCWRSADGLILSRVNTAADPNTDIPQRPWYTTSFGTAMILVISGAIGLIATLMLTYEIGRAHV